MTVYILNRIYTNYYGHYITTLVGVFSSKEKRDKYMLDNHLSSVYNDCSYWDWEDMELDALENKNVESRQGLSGQ